MPVINVQKVSYLIMITVTVREEEREGREGKGRTTQKMFFALFFVLTSTQNTFPMTDLLLLIIAGEPLTFGVVSVAEN